MRSVMQKYTETVRLEIEGVKRVPLTEKSSKKDKKKKKSKHRSSESSYASQLAATAAEERDRMSTNAMEADDMDHFINAVVEQSENPYAVPISLEKENKPKGPRGPHHGGPFITGDFMSETASKYDLTHV